MYYKARWYDPLLGRFNQADSIVPNPWDAASFDRYAYVKNNPVNYSDPTGHDGEGYVEFIKDAILFFQNLGWQIVGDPMCKDIHTNGADLVFTKTGEVIEVLAVELKKVKSDVMLGTLGKSVNTGAYGGTAQQVLKSAERFYNSSVEQLRVESKLIQDAGTNLKTALYTTSNKVSPKVQELFNGVYTQAKAGVANTVKALPGTLTLVNTGAQTLAKGVIMRLVNIPILIMPVYPYFDNKNPISPDYQPPTITSYSINRFRFRTFSGA
jgi:hypothetical protein